MESLFLLHINARLYTLGLPTSVSTGFEYKKELQVTHPIKLFICLGFSFH